MEKALPGGESAQSFMSCASMPREPLATIDDPDEFLMFFECAEDARELAQIRRRKTILLLKDELGKLKLDDEELDRACRSGQGWSNITGAEGVQHVASTASSRGGRNLSRLSTTDLTADSLVAQALQKWGGREGLDVVLVRLLDESSEELSQWLTRKTAKRMLNAADGDMKEALRMLNTAAELRIRDRHLLRSQRCDVGCNMCVLGYDVEQRPVIFVSMRSVDGPLASWWEQIILAFDKAVSYCDGEFGQFIVIADMHGFAPRKFMDKAAAKDIGSRLSSVFANRLYLVIVVDFSRIATACWMIVKPMLKEKTRKKFAFVSLAEAQRMVEKDLETGTVTRVCDLFHKSRDSSITPDELMTISRRGAIDPVPLGRP